ncbi:MAG: ABC transporter permease [Spirochaetales bacterium]|nr:ABC transporter permease [Spirochaetales bacterium]
MLRYIGKRLLHLIPVLFVITIVIFAIVELMPGDPVNAYLGVGSKTTIEQQTRIREQLGLDQGPVVRYFKWLGRVARLDFGRSLKYRKPVVDVIGTFIWNSFSMNLVVMILAFAISIPVGIRSAVKKYGRFDNFWTVFSLTGVSMPSFFFALLLIFFIAIPIKWIPLNGMRTTLLAAKGYNSTMHEVLDVAIHMLLPVIVLTISSLASLTRYVRNSVIEVINQDYIRTARSKGLAEKVVIYKHAFRNALLPIVTLLGFYIPGLFGGALILETVFLWPGIGNILYTSILDRDYSMVMAINVFYAILMVLGNLMADVSYALVDPRIKVK